MKLLIYSDLHFEFNKVRSFELPKDIDGDIMILAGDIMNFDDPYQYEHLREFLKPWGEKPVLYVAGNHEYYTDTNHSIDHLNERAGDRFKRLAGGVELLNNNALITPSISFFGGTMWTDLEDGTKAPYAARAMNDYRYINYDDRKLTTADTMEFHEKYLKALQNWLKGFEQDTEYKKVVISHHCPIRENGLYDEQAAYYSTKTRAIIEDPESKIDLWVYGHTHAQHDFMIGNTRIVSNPYGYHWHTDKDRFDPYGVGVEI